MFGFLKKKLGEVISRFSEKAKEEPLKEEASQPKLPEEEPAKKAHPAAAKAEKPKEAAERAKKESVAAEAPKEKEELRKKGLFEKIASAVTGTITTTKISEERFEQLFWDLELAMLENNVAVEVIGKIKDDLRSSLVEKPLPRGKVEDSVRKNLRSSIESLFVSGYDFKEKIKETAAEKKPVKIMFAGINGSGKTTTIAKMAKMLQDNKLKVVIAASDTFRAAAIHQLQEHADKLGVKLIKHDYGSDPAAVAFDAIKYAEAHGIDAVLIDTAGRLHSNVNLVDEMKKISRVAKPDFKIFVGESITGNDCVEQARSFNEAIGIDCIVLAKADVDEKGGAAISVSYITKKPIIFLGTGQGYGDLVQFRPELVVESLGLAS
ncbi:signal recognition particle-docking protein FtsY [Candidatus Woesearchaeota archaeon]|nr:signal recognition particle-docking protein FtsY [Candidatus Woesearchaeota archaeon]